MKGRTAVVTAFCVLVGTALAVSGCKSSHSAKVCSSCANDDVTLGSAALANGDIAGANQHFRDAVTQDANNKQAQAGLALTGIFLIQTDPEVQRIIGATSPAPRPAPADGVRAPRNPRLELLRANPVLDPGPRGMAMRVARAFALAATDPVAVSDVQNVLRTHVMPQLQDAENRLNVVEQTPTFTYPLTLQIGDQQSTVELDLGEIFTVDALINGVQGLLGTLVAYNFDVPNSDFDNVKADSLLAPGTSFGTLYTDGASRLAAARQNLLLLHTRFGQAVTSIQAETDDQTDDVIRQTDLQTPGFASLTADIDDFDAALRSPVTITVADALGNPFDLQLNAGAVFTNPFADFKPALPAHTFDANHDLVVTQPITFPNPTFNGIFPDMTNARWQQVIGTPAPQRLVARAQR